eukprot:4839399-Prymnesium_polylepis.1
MYCVTCYSPLVVHMRWPQCVMGKKKSKRGANLTGNARRDYVLAARQRADAEAALEDERDPMYEEDECSEAALAEAEAVDDAALNELEASDTELQPRTRGPSLEPGEAARRKRAQERQQDSRRRKKVAQEGPSITSFFSAAPSSQATKESCPAEVAVRVPLFEAGDVVGAIGVVI